jgi:L-ascorbate metabolism protein UlaG (beta-lactamase superfamily)
LEEIIWLGHAAFEMTLNNKKILIDPWLTGNPKAPLKSADISDVDYILVTHDHADHGLNDALKIAKRTNATFVGISELSKYASSKGVKNTAGMNIGGVMEADGLNFIMTYAVHSSRLGNPVGFVIRSARSSIYHPGDTALFGDMSIIGRLYHPRVFIVPIGGHYTMGPIEAIEAIKLVKPKIVIPSHYNTFPQIHQEVEVFTSMAKREVPEVEIHILEPGETLEL